MRGVGGIEPPEELKLNPSKKALHFHTTPVWVGGPRFLALTGNRQKNT